MQHIIVELSAIVGEKYCLHGDLIPDLYEHDETEDLRFRPDAVLLPADVSELCEVVKVCNRHSLPIVPRGAGTGLAGGALAVNAGVVILLERLNKIIEIDERNLQVTVEAGVITAHLQDTLSAMGLYYPPDPSSRAWSFVGGNVATNAGGPRAVKYGVVSQYVLNLEVVLADGSLMWTGANTLKNSTGYNLTQLFVGSEGTLGIITKAVLRLIPYPTRRAVLLVPFADSESACEAVSAIFRAGITPSALEFMEREALLRALRYMDAHHLELSESVRRSVSAEGVAAQLLIELDGFHAESLEADTLGCMAVLKAFGVDEEEALFAETTADQNDLWALRRCIGKATKHGTIYKEEDTVVPRAELASLLAHVKAVGRRYGFESVCYGHAGDGNLHVNILKGNLSDEFWQGEIKQAIREIFHFVKSLNGTISGEHGIGYVQMEYTDIVFDGVQMELLKGLKMLFDPKNIMNPHKVVKI